ncbi:SusD/RagB family nutrient-binding outer membrane lipoprotein [Desertivirga brevis]|uniref:SusD/RagB family nutrient-binding outer membrane lipoprotein n=1 Tax=Desertivirga brevis TaxID=2810310 RepID=UPI001A958BF8|nr:SusD/RagB family nutrient-binding outer membrane lipoprotein [Pedobacter sp. SYSU D00873]
MKKILFALCLLAGSATLLSGCKEQLEEKYFNPERSTEANVSGLFSSMLNNDRVRPSYYNVRTFLAQHAIVYGQTGGFSNSNRVYEQNDNYSSAYWNDFYTSTVNGGGVLALYREMENAYAALPESDKASNEIFLKAASVILYDEASKLVDLWGDIPFSEAGSLNATSTLKYPKYDDQRELYNTFISGLDAAATYFATAKTTSSFNRHDILLSGNVDNWRRYANSIRLRLLMRISNVDEAMARTEILKMLGNPAQYPLVDGGGVSNYNPATSDILLRPLRTNNETLNSALTEVSTYWAPDYMLNTVMLPANDPRIPVMFDKFGRTVNGVFIPNPTYRAMPIGTPAEQQTLIFTEYAILDSATFLQNRMIPGVVITAPEVNFIKAEAFQRWGSGDAKTTYDLALRQSINFYYYLNSINDAGGRKETMPASSVIDNFVNNSSVNYSGTDAQKLAKIYTQKWLHLGFLQANQAWSEYRRTNTPTLTFPVQTQVGLESPPTRLLYPAVEKTFNAANYEAVKAEDTRTTKIFWDVN